jgi:hypothetical protein
LERLYLKTPNRDTKRLQCKNVQGTSLCTKCRKINLE